MSLVETLHRRHLERQLRIMQAAFNHHRKTIAPAPIPAPVVVTAPKPPEPEAEPVILLDAVLRVETVRKVVSRHYGLTKTELLSERRSPKLVIPRQVIFYLCRKLTTLSFPTIGRAMGRMDHTTVLHGCRQIAKKMETDIQLRASVEMLTEQLGGDPE